MDKTCKPAVGAAVSLLLLLLFMAAGQSACATVSGLPTADEQAAANGRDFAAAHCAGCHNIALQGVSAYRAAPAFRSLRGNWTGPSLELRLERSPVHASADMPSRSLTPREADEVAALIRGLQAGKAPRGRPARAGFCNPIFWC